MRLRSSFWAGLNGDAPTQVSAESIENIRQKMLEALGLYNQVKYRSLDVQITFANDIDALWELRMLLRDALADRHGMDAANERIKNLTKLFVGLHPAAKSGNFFRR